jgi:hypothetical protein
MTGTKPSGDSIVVNTETLQCREAVQPGPQFGLPIVKKLRLGLQKCRESNLHRGSKMGNMGIQGLVFKSLETVIYRQYPIFSDR